MPATAPDAAALVRRQGCLRVVLLSAGSRGDVQPMVLLARRLQAQGCAVQALVPANLVRFCEDLGVEARPTFPDFREVWKQMGGWSLNPEDAGAEAEKANAANAAWMKGHPDVCVDAMRAMTEFKPDAVVWNCDGTASLKYEAEMGVPAVEVRCFWDPCPTADRTPARPTFSTLSPLVREMQRCVRVEGAGFDELNGMYLEDPSRRNFYNIDGSGAKCWFIPPKQWYLGNPKRYDGKATYHADSSNDQLPPGTGWHACDDGNGRPPMPVVRDLDRWLHSLPGLHHTGAWLPADDLQPSEIVSVELGGSMERLLAFLDAGPAPVAIGWGSMLARGMTPAAMLILALRALRACSPSHRAVIVGGWAQLECALSASSADAACGADEAEVLAELVKSLGGNCCFVAAAPHHWLLPRCSCAVHHGGAGTTQAALHAGCPVVITPISFDQPALAIAVGRLGVGVGFEKPLPSITPGELADAILRAERLAPAAEQLGQRLRREKGLAQAAAVLESFLREEVRPGKWRLQWLKVQGEAASAAHAQRQRLALGHFSKLRSQGKVDQTWIVEKSKSELTVQHNYANGHYRSYKLGSSEEVDQGRWSMHNGEYVQEAGFPVSGTLQGDAKKFWMGVDCSPLGYQKYTPAPFPYIYGYRVCNRTGDVETSIELNQSVLEGILH